MNAKDDAMADVIIDAIKRAIDGPKVSGRIQELETRLAALEKRPTVKFCGVWQRGKSYVAGDAATHHGGLWICQADTTGEPSQDFIGWTLAVKKGQAR